jgi:hypothetical protein
MKRTMVVMFLLALLLAWGGTAMAQGEAETLHAAAFANCVDADGDEVFLDADNAGANLVGIWPYFPKKASNWWNGIVVGNTDAEDTIAKNDLCLVGVTAEGTGVAAWYNQPIYPQHSKAFLKESISTDEEWEESVYMGVYSKNEAAINAFGFGLLGSKNDAGAAGAEFVDGNAITEAAADSLYFAYLPGGKWWSAIVLVNMAADDAEVTVEIVHSDGTVKEVDELELKSGNMLALTPAVLNELADDDDDPTKWDETKTAYVKVTSTQPNLAGWAQFGNGKASVGYVGGIN